MKPLLWIALGIMAAAVVLSLYLVMQPEAPHLRPGLVVTDDETLTPEPSRFTKVVLAQNLYEPMELEVLPDGSILFIERRGKIKRYTPDDGQVVVVETLDVYIENEDGLIGLTLDPNYAENQWIYLNYSVPDTAKQHISRFTFDGQTLDLSSEKVLLEIPTQRDQCCHMGGSLEFGPDGTLYISVGDNTNPFASDGFAPIDERKGPRICTDNSDTQNCDRSPWDAQKSAANTNDLRGKILRIRPEPDGTYSIPEGNLFAPDDTLARPEIYVMGNRNPFRINIDQHTGYLYWGEIGPDAGDADTLRGPSGHDEVNQARQAGNFGWPLVIADNKPYRDFDFASATPGAMIDPQAPVNDSPNNTGYRILPPAQPAMIWYPYGPSEEFPLTREGGRNAMAGPVYYYDDYRSSPQKLPRYYDGKLFIFDWMRGWIMTATLSESGDLEHLEPFMPDTEFNNPTDLVFGPDGVLYMLEYGSAWYAQNLDARLVRIDYTPGNRTPVARITADRTVGAAPLTVTFSGAESAEYDGDPLSYDWTFDAHNKAKTATSSFTFDTPGAYHVRLTVRDPSGASDSTSIQILVGNEQPEIAIEISGNQTFYRPGTPIAYAVRLSDREDGSLADSTIAPESVLVTTEFLAQGYDRAQSLLGHEAAQLNAQAIAGKLAIEQSDCLACHMENAPSIGPSYIQIAKRYTLEGDATGYLVDKIIHGGAGVWGDQGMAAHPQLDIQTVEQMVRYILSLAETTQPDGLPTTGIFTFEAPPAGRETGVHILRASYTDQGGPTVGPLTVSTVHIFRPTTLSAAAHDLGENVKIQRGNVLADSLRPVSFGFSNIDLTSVKALEIIPGEHGPIPFQVDISLDAPDGKLIGSAAQAGGSSGAAIPVEIGDFIGARDVYFTLRAVGTPEALPSIQSIRFVF